MGQSLNGFDLEIQTAPNPEAWASVGEIVNIQPPKYSREAIDDTNSKDTVKRSIASKLLNIDNPTFGIKFNPANASNLHWKETNGLLTLMRSGAVKTWRITSGSLSGSPTSVEWEFEAFVLTYGPGSMENGAGWDAELTLQLIGDVTEG